MQIALTAALTACALAIATPVAAQSARDVSRLLGSADPAQVRQGIELTGLAGTRGPVVHLSARIRQGLPPELLELALDTLLVLGRPEAGPVLVELARHRRAAVRRRALDALVACRPRGAAGALLAALSDADPAVRASAAQGLGQVGGRRSLDPLFRALDRGVLEAATAIGQLADAAAVARLSAYLGRVPFDAMTPALLEILARDNIPVATKLGIVTRLSELATSEARAFLVDYAASIDPGDSANANLRRAARDAAARIGR